MAEFDLKSDDALVVSGISWNRQPRLFQSKLYRDFMGARWKDHRAAFGTATLYRVSSNHQVYAAAAAISSPFGFLSTE